MYWMDEPDGDPSRPCSACRAPIGEAGLNPRRRTCWDCQGRNDEALKVRRKAHPIPAAVRRSVLERAGGRCQGCGKRFTLTRRPEIDHIVPLAKGGTSEERNLQALCRRCNRSKGTT
jgi:5-methylcytosine-specific restriction endonuclease McrA